MSLARMSPSIPVVVAGPLPRSTKVFVLLDKRKNLMKNYVGTSLTELARRMLENSGRILLQEVLVGEVFVTTGILSPREKVI